MTDQKRKYLNEMPSVDEGWWEAVLADEQRYASQRQQPAVQKTKPAHEEKVEPPPENESVQTDWDSVKQLYAGDRIIEMNVTGYNRGGLLVESESLAGFVPFSHLIDMTGREHDSDRDENLKEYVGKSLHVKVIECVPEEGRVVFSERAALSEPGKRAELFQSLKAGTEVTGTITNITDFGAFVDLGGVEGLIHISELSWGRVAHPNQVVRLGEQIKVQVLDMSAERCRVALSLKRLMPNPWERADADFPEGSVVEGTITKIISYGAFAMLDAGVEGLIHASEMSLGEGQSPRDLLQLDQKVKVRVLHVDKEHQRLGFSMILNEQ